MWLTLWRDGVITLQQYELKLLQVVSGYKSIPVAKQRKAWGFLTGDGYILASGDWMLTPIVVWPHPSVRAKYTSSRAESVRARHVKPAHLTPDCTQPQSNAGHWLAGLKDSVEPSWRWRELPRPPHTQHRGLSLNWTKFWIILIIDRFLEIGRQGGGGGIRRWWR